MKSSREYWSSHVAAIMAQVGSTSAYARQHGISPTALYYWQRKLRLEATPLAVVVAAPKPQGKFVALRVSDAVADMAPAPWRCTLQLSGGMRLEMSALPDPQWLAALGRATQGAH